MTPANEIKQLKRAIQLHLLLLLICLIALFIALLSSCVDEPLTACRQGVGTLRFNVSASTLSPDVRTTPVQTQSVAENVINDLHLLIYDDSGNLLRRSYFNTTTSKTCELIVPSGTDYTIYGIANTADETLFAQSGAATQVELKRTITGKLTAWSEITGKATLLMTGSLTNVSVGAGSTTEKRLSLWRLAARVTLEVDIAAGSDIAISGYRINSLPTQSYYMPHPLETEFDSSGIDRATVRASDAAAPAQKACWTASGFLPLSDVSNFTNTFYMYENRPGVNTGISGQQYKVRANAPGYPADSATYVVIYGHSPAYDDLSWTVYLGADNKTNFNIKRNCTYRVEVTLGINESDSRVTYVRSSPQFLNDVSVEGYTDDGTFNHYNTTDGAVDDYTDDGTFNHYNTTDGVVGDYSDGATFN
ncbi:MAG: DUF4906 domain-containing protein [Prevotellaceae bacterium]|jgi:hypothetical protein|nr:DUF4906 domain-containing protein [Prevotellaceae bacterium]